MALAQNDVQAAVAASTRAVELWDQVTGFRDVRMGPIIWLAHSEVLLESGDASSARDWEEKALEARKVYDGAASPE